MQIHFHCASETVRPMSDRCPTSPPAPPLRCFDIQLTSNFWPSDYTGGIIRTSPGCLLISCGWSTEDEDEERRSILQEDSHHGRKSQLLFDITNNLMSTDPLLSADPSSVSVSHLHFVLLIEYKFFLTCLSSLDLLHSPLKYSRYIKLPSCLTVSGSRGSRTSL